MNACETGRMWLAVKIALNAQLKRKGVIQVLIHLPSVKFV